MHIGSKDRTLVGLIVFTLMGCANLSNSIDKNEIPKSRDAYIYGRFSMNTRVGPFGVYATMGFEFACNSNRHYIIKFLVNDPIQIIKIPWGDTCSLTNMVYYGVGKQGYTPYTKPVPEALQRAIHFKAGKAYYLGDFVGAFGSDDPAMLQWELMDAKDNFENTTQEMKLLFKNLSALPTEDMMIH